LNKKIKKFEKFLDNEKTLFEGGHNERTPFSLVKQICNDIKLKGTEEILVYFNVEFVIDLLYNKNIKKNKITFWTDHQNKTSLVRKLGINKIISEDTMDANKKFDVIVGNPPFQSDKKGDASRWPLFVRDSYNLCKDNGIVALVLPTVYGSPGPNIRKGKINVWNEFISKSKILKLNLGECSRHFKSKGLSDDYFGYFISKKTKSDGVSEIETKVSKWQMDISDFNFLPIRGNEQDFSIVKKFQNLTKSIGGCPIRRGGGYEKNGLGNNIMFFKKARYQPYEKCVDFDFTGKRDIRKEITDAGWMVLPESSTEKKAKSVFFSKAFRYYASLMFSGITFNQGFHQSLPDIDKTKVWTDQEIYSLLGLTKSEISRIESNI